MAKKKSSGWGGPREGSGRPPKDDARTKSINIRVTEAERDHFIDTATERGEHLSEVIRRLLTEWAASRPSRRRPPA